MWRGFEAVGPDKVEQVHHRVFTSKASNAKSDVLDDRAGGLPMHKIAIGQSVLQKSDDGVDVERGLGSNVFKDE